MIWNVIAAAAGLVVVIGLIVGVVVALSNAKIRKERIELLERKVDEQRADLTDEQARCNQLDRRVHELEIKLDGAIGDVGREIGQAVGDRIAHVVLSRLRDERR